MIIEDLWVNYGNIVALRGTSLEVHRGEIVGLIGPNGAGKSTTLLTSMGVRSPSAGDVRLDGESIVGLAPEKIVRLGVSLVPERKRIFSTLTVEENLRTGATPVRNRSSTKATMNDVLGRFPVLERYLTKPAGLLSGGEQQQLAIGRALLSQPRLLLLDEPSLGLAPVIIDLVFERLGELRAEGMTILLVEQNAAQTFEIADRVYVLRGGQIVASGVSDELARDFDFEAYLGAKR